MKTVLFVPGFQEDFQSRDYASTVNAIKSKGYQVIFVDINWKRTILKDWVNQLDKIYSQHNPKNIILAGFSYGSLTAFVAAAKLNPAELWLFSLSPYFSDDMPKMKPAWLERIGARRTEDFKKLEFKKYAPQIQCRTLMFYGELEARKYPLIGRRSKIAHKTMSDSKLVKIDGVGHDVTDQLYINAIKSSI